MNDARKRRGAKQERRDARRARKRESIKTDDDVLITTIRAMLADHPAKLLIMVSYLIGRATAEPPSDDGSWDGKAPLAWLISSFVERKCRETTALLAVVAELLADDGLRQQCREEMSTRRDHLPKWIVGLPQVEVRRAERRADVLGDYDDLTIHLVLADGTELALDARLDHGCLSVVTDLAMYTSAPNRSLDIKRERSSPTDTFVDMDPADARSWIEFGLERGNFLPRSDEWRTEHALARWMIARLPSGGAAYAGPEWDDDAVSELLDRFFAAPAGAPFADRDYRDFLRELCDTGSGDPGRWSAARISDILRSPDDYLDIPLEIAVDAPSLLRAYVPFMHADNGIPQELTDDAIATIDEMSLRYRRKLLDKAIDHYDDGVVPSRTYPDRAS